MKHLAKVMKRTAKDIKPIFYDEICIALTHYEEAYDPDALEAGICDMYNVLVDLQNYMDLMEDEEN